jgi:hypothetical protein
LTPTIIASNNSGVGVELGVGVGVGVPNRLIPQLFFLLMP